VLNIFFRVRSGGDLIDHRSVSGGQRQKGAKMNAVILFFFFLSRQRHFRKDKTHKTHILQHIHLSYTTQNQHFFLLFSWNWCGEQVFIYFSSLGFSFGLFLTFFKWWQWLEGHSFWASVGNFCFWIIRIYSDLFGLLGRLGLVGNHGKNFAGNLVKLGFHFVHDGVDLGLV